MSSSIDQLRYRIEHLEHRSHEMEATLRDKIYLLQQENMELKQELHDLRASMEEWKKMQITYPNTFSHLKISSSSLR